MPPPDYNRENLERIADALERLVIAADSIATVLSLQAIRAAAEPHEHLYKGTGGPCTICQRGIYVERAEEEARAALAKARGEQTDAR